MKTSNKCLKFKYTFTFQKTKIENQGKMCSNSSICWFLHELGFQVIKPTKQGFEYCSEICPNSAEHEYFKLNYVQIPPLLTTNYTV